MSRWRQNKFCHADCEGIISQPNCCNHCCTWLCCTAVLSCRYCHEPGHESDNCPIKRCSLCREQGHRWQDCPTHVQDAFADGRALPWQLQAAKQHGGVDQQHQVVPKGSRGSQHSKAGGSSRGDRGAGSSSRGRGGQRARNPNENSFNVLM